MAGRSAAKRTSPRRTSGGQREGRASRVGSENTTTVTSDGGSSGGGGASKGGSSGGGGKPSVKGSAGKVGENRWDQFKKFCGHVKGEWFRVTWPTKIELAQATRVVLWTLMVFMIYLGVLDWIFIKIFSWGQTRYQ